MLVALRNLDPKIGTSDRIGAAAGGLIMIVIGLLGRYGHAWLDTASILLGVVLVINGIGGT